MELVPNSSTSSPPKSPTYIIVTYVAHSGLIMQLSSTIVRLFPGSVVDVDANAIATKNDISRSFKNSTKFEVKRE